MEKPKLVVDKPPLPRIPLKIIIIKRESGRFDFTRIRQSNSGESYVGFKSLEEVLRELRICGLARENQ
jgi:hypothetical protein